MEGPEEDDSPLGYLSPYLDETGRRTRLEVMARDARIVRENPPTRRRPRTERQRAARRGRVGIFSPKSRLRLQWHLRNTQGLTDFITLTYSGPPPMDDRVLKLHLSAFVRWVTDKDLGIVWKREFGKRGRPHVHAVTKGPICEDEVRKKWASITGCEPTESLVECGPIRDPVALEWYMTKRQDHKAHRVPEGYENVGKWWHYAGPGASPVPLLIVSAEEGPLAPIVRAAKAAQEAKRGKSPKRDNGGVTSRRLYDGGGAAMARDVARYAEALGIGETASIPGCAEKGFLTAAGAAENGE